MRNFVRAYVWLSGIMALANLAQEENNIAVIASNSGVESLMAALSNHYHHGDVSEYACVCRCVVFLRVSIFIYLVFFNSYTHDKF